MQFFRYLFITFIHSILTFLPILVIAQDYNRTVPNIKCPAGIQVNTYTGNMFYQRPDLYIPAVGPDLQVYFTYNSNNTAFNHGFGNGWTINYHMQYEVLTDQAVMHRADGRRDTFDLVGGAYIARPGVFDTLILYEADKFLLKSKYGIGYYFENATHQKLTRIVDRNNNVLTLNYVGGLLAIVSETTGRMLQFTFASGLLAQVTDNNSNPPRTLLYTYDNNGNLISATDPLGHQITYSYDLDRQLAQVKDKRDHTFDIAYLENGKVYQVTSEQTEVTMSYNPVAKQTTASELVHGIYLVNTYTYDNLGRNTQMTNACCGYNVSYTYDADHNFNSAQDANGNMTTFSCDDRGNYLISTNIQGYTSTSTYEPVFNLPLSVADFSGNQTHYDYDANGNCTRITRPEGVIEEFTYDAQGKMTSSRDGEGYLTTYTYDANGYLSILQHPIGTEYFVYDAVGNLGSHTDANGNSTSYGYDRLNRLVTLEDALGNTTTYTYDPHGNKTSMTNARGFTWQYIYDTYDRLLRKITPIQTTTQYAYDAHDNLLEMIDPNGNTTTYTYNERNQLIGIEDALQHNSTYSYDPVGNRISATDANGYTIRYAFDDLNQIIRDTSALSEINYYLHDPNGNLLIRQLPNWHQVHFGYDSLDRMYSTHDNLGTLAHYAYDFNSNLLTETNALGQVTEYRYDAMNRLVQEIDPKNDTLGFRYDLNGNLIEVNDRKGRRTTYTYDALDRRVSMRDPLNHLTTYSYDEVGNLATVTDANGNETNYYYDPLDRLILESFADNSNTRLAYDPAGNLIERRDNNKILTRYSYDPLNRLIARDYPGSNDDTFTYDPVGLLLSAQNQDATLAFTYDPTYRMLSESLNGVTTTYQYDYLRGGRTISYPGGRLIIERVNERYQLDTIFDGGNALAVYAYDTISRIVSRSYPTNGTAVQYGYDNNNRVVTVTHLPTGIADFSYAYDRTNNLVFEEKLHQPTHSERYHYDALDRLSTYLQGPLVGGDIPAPNVQTDYAYDPVGNRNETTVNTVLTTYVSNNMNAYVQVGEDQFSHDRNGNRQVDGSRINTFDYENRLIEVDQNGLVTSYSYDPLGRRITKQNATDELHYYYDGQRVIEERDSLGNLSATYVYGRHLDEVLNMQRGNGMAFYHQDAKGSIVALTDQLGNLQERYTYDAYGSVEMTGMALGPIPESILGNPYFFTGRRLDAETGLYYYRARYYDPEQGRFLQRDPLGYSDGMNMYAYGANNPINNLDPMGTYWTKVGSDLRWEREWDSDGNEIVPTYGGMIKVYFRGWERLKHCAPLIFRYNIHESLARSEAARLGIPWPGSGGPRPGFSGTGGAEVDAPVGAPSENCPEFTPNVPPHENSRCEEDEEPSFTVDQIHEMFPSVQWPAGQPIANGERIPFTRTQLIKTEYVLGQGRYLVSTGFVLPGSRVTFSQSGHSHELIARASGRYGRFHVAMNSESGIDWSQPVHLRVAKEGEPTEEFLITVRNNEVFYRKVR